MVLDMNRHIICLCFPFGMVLPVLFTAYIVR